MTAITWAQQQIATFSCSFLPLQTKILRLNLKPAEVIELSRKASGTHHPAPLSLVQPDNSPAPSVTKAEEDHWIFTGTIKLVSGQEMMPIALVVKGQAQQ